MTPEELDHKLSLLETQQSYQTNALRAALEARWAGEADSVAGWVSALDPNVQLNPLTPLYAEGE